MEKVEARSPTAIHFNTNKNYCLEIYVLIKCKIGDTGKTDTDTNNTISSVKYKQCSVSL